MNDITVEYKKCPQCKGDLTIKFEGSKPVNVNGICKESCTFIDGHTNDVIEKLKRIG